MNKFWFLTVAGLNLQKKDRAVFLSHWSLLTELCCCYVELGKVYLLQGAVREAKRFLKDGREITRRFLSANRCVKALLHYAICLAILLRNFVATQQSRKHKSHNIFVATSIVRSGIRFNAATQSLLQLVSQHFC